MKEMKKILKLPRQSTYSLQTAVDGEEADESLYSQYIK